MSKGLPGANQKFWQGIDQKNVDHRDSGDPYHRGVDLRIIQEENQNFMTWHILPQNDTEPHDESSTCKCEPGCQVMEFGDIIIVHNSFDGRIGLEITNQILKLVK